LKTSAGTRRFNENEFEVNDNSTRSSTRLKENNSRFKKKVFDNPEPIAVNKNF
jgi:hypothetical protein